MLGAAAQIPRGPLWQAKTGPQKIPGTYGSPLNCTKGVFAGIIELEILAWEVVLLIKLGLKCHHKCPCKKGGGRHDTHRVGGPVATGAET